MTHIAILDLTDLTESRSLRSLANKPLLHFRVISLVVSIFTHLQLVKIWTLTREITNVDQCNESYQFPFHTTFRRFARDFFLLYPCASVLFILSQNVTLLLMGYSYGVYIVPSKWQIISVNSPIIATPESAPIIAFPVLQLYERRHQLLSMLSEYSKSRAPILAVDRRQ